MISNTGLHLLCQLEPAVARGMLQIIFLLMKQIRSKANSLYTSKIIVKDLRATLKSYGLNHHENYNNNTTNKSTIQRRLDCLQRVHEYLNDTVDDSIDLTAKFVCRLLKHSEAFNTFFLNKFRNLFLREQNHLRQDLKRKRDLQINFAFTTVLRYFSERDVLAFRTSVSCLLSAIMFVLGVLSVL